MREITIIVNDSEAESKLKKMNQAGISISRWFINAVLAYQIPPELRKSIINFV